jgi:PAN domain
MTISKTFQLRSPSAALLSAALFAAAFLLSAHSQNLYAQGFDIKYNFGLERGDYKDFDLANPAWESCRDACATETTCLSFTYTIPIAGPNGRPAHCWLKNIVPRGEGRDWCISGIKKVDGGCGNDYFVQAPRTVAAGAGIPITYGFRGPRPQATGDWIALLKAGTNNYVDWFWVKDIQQGCGITMRGQAAGEYELKYLLEGGYEKVMAVTRITVQ